MQLKKIKYKNFKVNFTLGDFFRDFEWIIADIYGDFNEFEYIKVQIDSKLLSFKIDSSLKMNDTVSIDYSEVSNTTTIYISDLFLAYLWCQIFVNIVKFDYVKSQQLNTAVSFDKDLLKSANLVDTFSDRIIKFSERTWGTYTNSNAILPNPFKVEISHETYIEKANAVFVNAISFIIQHEFNHFYFEEHRNTTTDIKKNQEMEIDADSNAINIINKLGKEKQFIYAAGIGMTLTVLHKIYLKMGIVQSLEDEHPPIWIRLKKAISSISTKCDSDDIQLVYEILAYTLHSLYGFHDLKLENGFNYEDSKEYLDDMIKRISKLT